MITGAFLAESASVVNNKLSVSGGVLSGFKVGPDRQVKFMLVVLTQSETDSPVRRVDVEIMPPTDAEPLTIERLADQAGMSPRHFVRVFTSEMAVTPAKAVERLRLEAARERVETGREPIDAVAREVGFGDQERMRRAFIRAFGQPPQSLRRAARAG